MKTLSPFWPIASLLYALPSLSQASWNTWLKLHEIFAFLRLRKQKKTVLQWRTFKKEESRHVWLCMCEVFEELDVVFIAREKQRLEKVEKL